MKIVLMLHIVTGKTYFNNINLHFQLQEYLTGETLINFVIGTTER